MEKYYICYDSETKEVHRSISQDSLEPAPTDDNHVVVEITSNMDQDSFINMFRNPSLYKYVSGVPTLRSTYDGMTRIVGGEVEYE